MKPVFALFVACLIVFHLVSCSKTESPTGTVELINGKYVGTFSVTFKSYQNYPWALNQTGDISITFSDSGNYYYSATANYSSNDSAYKSLGDGGAFSRTDHKIVMNDDSWLRMDPRWHNSLYLLDTFAIQTTSNQMKISQDNSFAIWSLNLAPAK